MSIIQMVRCPNCGNFAERQILSDCQTDTSDRIVQTACSQCDYLMIMNVITGKVLEAYSPSQLSQSLPPEPVKFPHAESVSPYSFEHFYQRVQVRLLLMRLGA